MTWYFRPGVSVRRRLVTLVVIQSTIAFLLVLIAFQTSSRRSVLLLLIGGVGIATTLTLGLLVNRAISPRIRRLVEKVDHFRDSGVNEKVVDTGGDEIAVLANALDTGFSAIAERDRERTQFLAVMAHELKTPIASIQGFVSLLKDGHQDPAVVKRSLDVLSKQAWRLSRLVEQVLMAIQARGRDLRFEPVCFDLAELVERVMSEVESLSTQQFNSSIESRVRVLGDPALIEHAMWAVFTCMSAISTAGIPLNVDLKPRDADVCFTVQVSRPDVLVQDIQSLLVPFGAVEYERHSSIRAPVGLYLVREIVRVHNGRLQIFDVPGTGPRLVIHLPR